MRPPIIVLSDDVDFFETVADAERYLEPEDIESGLVTHIYDRDGRALRAVIIPRTFLTPWRLKIEDTLEQPEITRFRDALILLLTRNTGDPVESFSNLSVNELIERAGPFKTL